MELRDSFTVDPDLIEHLTDALLSVIPSISLHKSKKEIANDVELMMVAMITQSKWHLDQIAHDDLEVIKIALKYYSKETKTPV